MTGPLVVLGVLSARSAAASTCRQLAPGIGPVGRAGALARAGGRRGDAAHDRRRADRSVHGLESRPDRRRGRASRWSASRIACRAAQPAALVHAARGAARSPASSSVLTNKWYVDEIYDAASSSRSSASRAAALARCRQRRDRRLSAGLERTRRRRRCRADGRRASRVGDSGSQLQSGASAPTRWVLVVGVLVRSRRRHFQLTRCASFCSQSCYDTGSCPRC